MPERRIETTPTPFQENNMVMEIENSANPQPGKPLACPHCGEAELQILACSHVRRDLVDWRPLPGQDGV
jgi:hypothetical protein